MKGTCIVACHAFILVYNIWLGVAFSATELSRAKLQQALSSPSKKLTISPEIIIPEPTDPTALLLQSTEITHMSQMLRVKAKGNAVFLSGSLTSLKVFCREQQSALGNFPGPLPVIYCDSSSNGNILNLDEISDAGVDALVYKVNNGAAIASKDDVGQDHDLKDIYQSAEEKGMHVIPELVLNSHIEWNEENTSSLITAIEEICGKIPVACILSYPAPSDDEGALEGHGGRTALPTISSNISKKISVLGSVREVAGGGRIGDAVGSLKEAGFNGAVLRCECLPGFRMNPDLKFVGGFWTAAISDIKSLKSKNFNFRSKVALERDVPMEWYNYQKNVMESGALGKMGGGEGDPLNTDNGDYKGF